MSSFPDVHEWTRRYHRERKSSDLFENYRECLARRAEPAEETACGHAVARGDLIGWNPTAKRAQCRACWARWTMENARADFDEQIGGGR